MPSPAPVDTRQFKDKLKDAIAEAEVAQARALRAEQAHDARSLATDLLVQGHPHAFCGVPPTCGLCFSRSAASTALQAALVPHVCCARSRRSATCERHTTSAHAEFHRIVVTSEAPHVAGGAPDATPAAADLAPHILRHAHGRLVAADAARRQGDAFAEFEAHNELGLHFEQAGLLALAAAQYRRCLAVAERAEWLEGRMATETALGLGARPQPAESAQHMTALSVKAPARAQRAARRRPALRVSKHAMPRLQCCSARGASWTASSTTARTSRSPPRTARPTPPPRRTRRSSRSSPRSPTQRRPRATPPPPPRTYARV